MYNNPCPCRHCVPPKRNAECHSKCKDYKEWSIECQKFNAKVREINRAENDCFPHYFKRRRRRRKYGNNKTE